MLRASTSEPCGITGAGAGYRGAEQAVVRTTERDTMVGSEVGNTTGRRRAAAINLGEKPGLTTCATTQPVLVRIRPACRSSVQVSGRDR